MVTGRGAPGKAPAAAPRTAGEDLQSARLPPLQEAAVLVSAGFAAGAQALLDDLLKSDAGSGNRQGWLMVLEILRGQDRRTDYDWYAAGYRDQFGQSAPAWPDDDEANSADRRRAQGRQRPDFYPLQADGEGRIDKAIAELPAFARTHGSVRVDVGELTDIGAADAVALAVALRTLRREGLAIWVNRPAVLEGLLHAAVNRPGASGASEGHWGLLLELLILQRRPEAYERAALEYAVARERRAPPWEDYVNPIVAAYEAAQGNAPQAVPAAADAFSLRGVVSATSDEDLRRLSDQAEALSEVVIDMSSVLRIDFAACPMLHAVVSRLAGGGKRVIFSGLSELNAALLEAFGFNRLSVLLRKDAT